MRFGLAATLLCAPLIALVFGPPAAGQEAPPSIFGERIDVRVINLEAVVVDRQGNRVSGLAPEDFRLTVDGRELPITYFTEIAGGRSASPRPGAAPGAQETGPAAVPGLAAGEPVGTGYVVFIDELFVVTPRDRNRVLEEIAARLSRLGPADEMAIVAFNGRQLDLISDWSRSQRQLRAALEAAARRPTHGFLTTQPLSELDRDVALDAGGTGLPVAQVEDLAAPAIYRLEEKLRRLIFGVTAALRSFSQAPGRKTMLLLSGGWPYALEDFVLGAGSPLDRFGTYVGPEIWRPVYDTANLLGFTLYPIDVPGQAGPPVDAAAADPASPFQRISTLNRESELHATLHQLADKTGGEPLIDGSRLFAFDRVVDDTRAYYWLGFVPDWQGNDETHEIELTVLKPGLKVRHRESFQDLSRQTEIDFTVESALLFGRLPGAAPLAVELGPAPAGKKRRIMVPLEVTIPLDAVTFLPVADGYAAELELRVAVLDERGDRNEIAAIPVVLSGPSPPSPGEHAIYETALKLRRQHHEVVVALHDPATGQILAAVGTFSP